MAKSVKPSVIGIVGATASGKSSAAMALATHMPIEIVCMDSMQVFRNMDIGTAKPIKEDQQIVPHHMLDIVNPGEPFSVAEYAERAQICISAIHTREHLPVLAGGTGLYLRALSFPMSMGNVKGNEDIRKRYILYSGEHGRPALHALLAERDPVSAARLPVNDVHRIIRALEVLELTGVPFSAQKMPAADACPYKFHLYAPDVPREILYERIDHRVDDMITQGLAEEVELLLKAGVSPDAQSMQGLGYKELIPVIQRCTALVTAIDNIKRRTRNYAKRQITWFRRDARIQWLDPETESFTGRIIKEMETLRDDKN
jgi:tRNA dimethylallyltransferase